MSDEENSKSSFSLLRRCGPAERSLEAGRTDEAHAQDIVDTLTIAAGRADQILIVDLGKAVRVDDLQIEAIGQVFSPPVRTMII